MGTAQGDLVLRPDRLGLWAIMGLTTVFGVVVTAATAVRFGGAGALVAAVLFTAAIAPLAAYVQRARTIVTATEIIVIGAVRRRNVSRARAAELVRASVVRPDRYGNMGETDTVFVLDARGKGLIKLYSYQPGDLERVVEALNLPCSGPERPVTPNELAETWPGIVPYYDRYPFPRGMLIGVALLLSVLLVAVLAALVIADPATFG